MRVVEGAAAPLLLILFIVVTPGDAQATAKVPSPVLDLNDKFMEVKDQGHWFITFFAPWCGHCKKLMPTWEQLGHALADEGRVRVGKIDCTRYSSVASQLGINGFPTIIYFKDGKQYTYEGDRTKNAMLDFANKLSGPEIRKIEEGEGRFQKANASHYKDGYFLLIADPEDSIHPLVTQFEAASKDLFVKSYFFSTSPSNVPPSIFGASFPAVFVVHREGPSQFDPGHVVDSGEDLTQWVQKARWPLFPEITYGNLYDIGTCCNKLLVIANLDSVRRRKKGNPDSKFNQVVEETASKKKHLRAHFQFGWNDGNELANNIVLGTMAVPSMVVLNVSSQEFWLPDDPSNITTPDSLALFLENILSGMRPPMGGRGLVQRIKRVFFDVYSTIYLMFATQPLLSTCLFGLPTGIISIICYTLCSADMSVDADDVYRDSDDEEEEEPRRAQGDPDHEHWE